MKLFSIIFLKTTILVFTSLLIGMPAHAFSKNPSDTILHASDTLGPVVTINVQFKRITLKTYSSTNEIIPTVVFPKNSELSIIGGDAATALKEIFVVLNNTAEQRYKTPLRLTARGRHTLRVRAVNYAGNETNFSIDFIIEE